MRPEYNSWRSMLERCYKTTSNRYHRYGGRGIKVCARWRESFDHFLADMGPKPKGHRISIDRLDNDGDYELGNCRWATPLEQAQNFAGTRVIEFNGERLSKAAWARRIGIVESAINKRFSLGWPLERILTAPKRGAIRAELKGDG